MRIRITRRRGPPFIKTAICYHNFSQNASIFYRKSLFIVPATSHSAAIRSERLPVLRHAAQPSPRNPPEKATEIPFDILSAQSSPQAYRKFVSARSPSNGDAGIKFNTPRQRLIPANKYHSLQIAHPAASRFIAGPASAAAVSLPYDSARR